MMLIEAMKELKVIEKKMVKNSQSISEYAAVSDNERLPFGNKDAQSKEVRSLIQANGDLLQRYLNLKKQIEKTNLETIVEVNGIKYTISDLLILKRKLAKLMVGTYQALNENAARARVTQMRRGQGEREPVIERYYSEGDKVAGIREWDDLYHAIDSRLEVINATTPLL